MDHDKGLFQSVLATANEADRDVIELVSGSPDWEPPPALRRGLHEAADGPPTSFSYSPTAGLSSLRSKIATRRGVDREGVVVTNGACEANYLALQAALEHHTGEEVILLDPAYPYYPRRVSRLGGTISWIDAGPTGTLKPTAIDEAMSSETAAIVLNTPNNPTGAIYDRAVMSHAIDVAAEFDAAVIADEVYDHFCYSDAFESIHIHEAANAITVTSFSKTMAITGLRVGYVIAPPTYRESIKDRHMLQTVSASRPAQRAVLSALEATDREYYAEKRTRMEARIRTFRSRLEEADIPVTNPNGGFYVMANLPGFDGSFETVEWLIETAGVAGMPGAAFGDTCTEWVRFALLDARTDEAADRIVTAVQD